LATALSLPAVPLSRPRRSLPDIARHQTPCAAGAIDRVGMEGIDLPIRVRDGGALLRVPARADAFVSLDRADAKGIHMSRLFLALQEVLAKEELRPETLRQALDAFVVSHGETSRSGFLTVRFDHLVERDALESDHRGWKSYPVEVQGALREGELALELAVTVPYSSTCPCSAALSRLLIRDAFERRFGAGRHVSADDVARWLASEEGMIATPHSQRSYADVRVALAGGCDAFPILPLVDAIEAALGTPVQSAVKREDEQAFAALNGGNLMFCEDAARRVKRALDAEPLYRDYRVHVRHEESLHPHDAVSILVKGVPGGMRA
jgi:GTP cyclohydrolase I